MTPDEKLFDEVLNQALNILRLSAGKKAATIARLEAMAKELVKKLNEQTLAELNRREIQKVIRGSEKIIREYYGQLQFDLELEPVAEIVARRTATSLELALGLEGVKLPKQSYFRSVVSDVLIEGSPAADWWRGQEVDTARRFAGAVRTGLTNAETNQQIINRIVGINGQPGVMDTTRRNAATLVQTSVQAVANDARQNTFEANPDLITGLRQVSTLDSHTSLICVSYSGASWSLKDKKPIGNSPPWNGGCPRHFNCRSLEVPILKTFRELGLDIDEVPSSTRASEIGQVSAKTDFNDFLKRRGVEYQDEVLGEGRAELWRKGKITLRDLVSGEGRPLSLEELRRKFA